MTFLPDELVKLLVRRKAPKVNRAKLTKLLKANGVKPDKTFGPFIPAKENLRRYGFPLPKEVRALLEIADTWAIEDFECVDFKYVRVAPEGWELPAKKPREPYFVTVLRRFEWNAFSNMQVWEHFAGLMSLGWDGGDNRYFVSTIKSPAPVFWMDHEYGTFQYGGCVARSLENFLRVQFGGSGRVPANERTLSSKPSSWEREKDGARYLEADGPLALWPPFLARRCHWIVGAILGHATGFDSPESACFDAKLEVPLAKTSEPLAMYWLFRSFYFADRDLFDEIVSLSKNLSPLVESIGNVMQERWNAKPKESSLAAARSRLKREKHAPRKAKFTRAFPRTRLA